MEQLHSLFHHLYQSLLVPIYLFEGNFCILNFPDKEDNFDPPKQLLDQLISNTKEIDYIGSDFFAYYGSIKVEKHPNCKIIIGPVFQMNIQKECFRELVKNYVVEQDKIEQFSQFMNSLPIMSLHQFLNILKTIFFFTNKKEITTKEILKSKDKVLKDNQAVIKTYESRENFYYNNSYSVENRICSYVENGELDKVSEFIEEPFQIHEGKIAEDNLRQGKNTAIVFITLITRAAIRGGVDTESAYQLSDEFIRQTEQFQSLQPIQHLIQEVLFELTDQVRRLKLDNTGGELLPLIRYIKKNINQPLSVTLLADKFGYSRGYLSTLFKKINGISLQDYITKCKIEEAKQLLTHTDKPISTISNYLCFSSQSHFQTVFKKTAGESPAIFRKSKNQLKEYQND